MTYRRGCILCGWTTLNSPVPNPTCPDCGHHIAAGPPQPKEDLMSMEKRGVVNTDKEKTAHEQVKKDLLPEKKNQPPKPDQKVEEKK